MVFTAVTFIDLWVKTARRVFLPGNLLAVRAWDIISQLFENQGKVHLKLSFILDRKIYWFGFFWCLKSVPCQASLLNWWAKGRMIHGCVLEPG